MEWLESLIAIIKQNAKIFGFVATVLIATVGGIYTLVNRVWPGLLPASAESRAKRLELKAKMQHDQAQEMESLEIQERFLKKTIALLERIIRRYPGTNTAAQLVGGKSLLGIELKKIKGELADLERPLIELRLSNKIRKQLTMVRGKPLLKLVDKSIELLEASDRYSYDGTYIAAKVIYQGVDESLNYLQRLDDTNFYDKAIKGAVQSLLKVESYQVVHDLIKMVKNKSSFDFEIAVRDIAVEYAMQGNTAAVREILTLYETENIADFFTVDMPDIVEHLHFHDMEGAIEIAKSIPRLDFRAQAIERMYVGYNLLEDSFDPRIIKMLDTILGETDVEKPGNPSKENCIPVLFRCSLARSLYIMGEKDRAIRVFEAACQSVRSNHPDTRRYDLLEIGKTRYQFFRDLDPSQDELEELIQEGFNKDIPILSGFKLKDLIAAVLEVKSFNKALALAKRFDKRFGGEIAVEVASEHGYCTPVFNYCHIIFPLDKRSYYLLKTAINSLRFRRPCYIIDEIMHEALNNLKKLERISNGSGYLTLLANQLCAMKTHQSAKDILTELYRLASTIVNVAKHARVLLPQLAIASFAVNMSRKH